MVSLRQLGCCVALSLLTAANAGAAEPALHAAPLRFGAAWYPEQWPERVWDHDLNLMEAAHINVVRVGEFSWSKIEPAEGRYDFAWLDRAIAMAASHHIKVVIGTPTAAPPAWLTQEYPDVLRVTEDGAREQHGNRMQYSFASTRYRTFARDIAERLAARYGHNPDVIGWQIDNEIGPPSFDDMAKAQFHAWLAKKYGTIANLNTHWTTTYWSQTYDTFDQVPMHSTNENPALLLDWKRFVTDTWRNYVQNQSDVIRAHIAPTQFVTINTMHWNAGFDHFALHRDLDLAAWDDYIPDGHYVWDDNALLHDVVRGYKGKNYWVMETQAGFVNYGAINRSLDPGRMREMAWQAVGHGADALLYWQWRSALNGQEQYYGTLVGPDGEPVPFYREAKRIGAEFAKASAALSDTQPKAEVALLQSYESRWAIDFQRHSKEFDPVAEFFSFYKPLVHIAQVVDVVSPDVPLAHYHLVIAPALNVLSREEAARMADYVRDGGHLILGPRSGMKDEYDALWPNRQPGPLAGVLGGHVEQYYALKAPVAVSVAAGVGHAAIWAEALSSDDPSTQTVMRYGAGDGWLAGQPAALTRRFGKGTITYLGAWLDESTMRSFLVAAATDAAVRPRVPAPDDVEVSERDGAGKQAFILINHADATRTIRLPSPMHNVLTGRTDTRTIILAPDAVAVLLARRKTAP